MRFRTFELDRRTGAARALRKRGVKAAVCKANLTVLGYYCRVPASCDSRGTKEPASAVRGTFVDFDHVPNANRAQSRSAG